MTWVLRTCSLMAVRSPNTKKPPIKPAKNVSELLVFPPFILFCKTSNALYNETNFARPQACCTVMRTICFARVFQL